MPIPPHDPFTRLLPPFLGASPTSSLAVSPYQTTLAEFCQRYSHTAPRKAILHGLLDLRQVFISNNLFGFQWIAGSFVDDIENLAGRAPNDVDVVTFYTPPSGPARLSVAPIVAGTEHPHCKAAFKVDHYTIPLDGQPPAIVDGARFWYALFSHTRLSEWKGLVRLSLDSSAGDAAARAILGART